jgi:hypothetical protein
MYTLNGAKAEIVNPTVTRLLKTDLVFEKAVWPLHAARRARAVEPLKGGLHGYA